MCCRHSTSASKTSTFRERHAERKLLKALRRADQAGINVEHILQRADLTRALDTNAPKPGQSSTEVQRRDSAPPPYTKYVLGLLFTRCSS
jgi:hypothetical protein